MIRLLLFIFFSTSLQAQELNPLFYRQWGLLNEGQSIFIREAELNFPAQPGIPGKDINFISKKEIEQALGKQLKEVVVAVIDTGMDLEHEDLKDRYWKNQDGKIGKNFLNPKADPIDDKGHGTHVAGIIAANDNELGIMGIAGDNVKIMPLKVLNKAVDSFAYNRKLITDYFADAIEFAVDNKADVINMSVGFPQLVLTDKFKQALKKAQTAQIPVIVAAGNNRKDLPVFPCNLSGVICVGAIDNTGTFSIFSNYGQAVDIVAPGESIVSTYPMQQESRRLRIMGYEKLKGTSQAAPSVAAIAAMIKATHPTESLNELKARLLCTTDDVSSNDEKFSLFGIVNMKKSILGDVPPCLTLNFKQKSQVVINNKDLDFTYDVEIKKLSGESGAIELETIADERISFQKSSDIVEDVKAGETKTVTLKGTFTSLDADSLVPVYFHLKANNKEYKFRANISFSLGNKATSAKTFILSGVRTQDIFQKRGVRAFSLLSYVYSATNKKSLPEYFFRLRKVRQPMYGFVRIVNEKVERLNLKLNGKEQLINILKGDFGTEANYMALIQDTESKKFTLNYMNNDFKVLKSIFFEDNGAIMNLSSPINREGNLINIQKRLVNFEWLKKGKFYIPVVTQEGLLPTEDNSIDLIDFEAPELRVRRYALMPNKEGKISPRSLLSVERRAEIREEMFYQGLEINSWENIRIENVLKTPQENNGVLEYLLSVGEFYERRYFRFKLNSLQDYSLEPIYNLNVVISGNINFPQILPPESKDKSLISYRLIGRDNGRIAYTDVETGNTHVQAFETDGYADPVFGFLSGLKMNGSYSAFIESRYWIHYFEGEDKHFRYPVNRESSFPGVQFSETMEPVTAYDNDIAKTGIFVNSTLLYGNQIHIIVPKKDKLIRPLKYTVEIPQNCAYALPARLGEKEDSLVLNCIENKKSVLKFIELN